MVVGRGSFTEAFPLFGLPFEDYDSLFAEHLDLLLEIREHEHVHWAGRHRPALTGQGVYPRPLQDQLPIWLGARPRRGISRRATRRSINTGAKDPVAFPARLINETALSAHRFGIGRRSDVRDDHSCLRCQHWP